MFTVAFHTLGCKVNQTESEALSQLLSAEGYTIVSETENPDVIIINTCTVTGTGSSKSRKMIRRMAKDHPESTIAVIGCYSQTQPDEVAAIEGVDIILGTQNRADLIEYLRKVRSFSAPVLAVSKYEHQAEYEELPLVESESRARAMLKIQDGCSQYCTYCIVPYARGPSRSRKPERVMAEAVKLLDSGYKEIVLTGVHIGAYGHDLTGAKTDLAQLIRELAQLPGMNRLRLGSIEPMEFSLELLDVISEHRQLCPHFHIPLQSGCDDILARMGRPYTTLDYARLLEAIRKSLPDAAIASDILTGFPGETDRQHEEALHFIADCRFAGIHAFPYSRRPGTPAASMPGQIPNRVKAARVQDLIRLGQESSKHYADQFIGRNLELLVERIEPDGTVVGHTRNYLELRVPPGHFDAPGLSPGDICEVTVGKALLQR